MELLGQFIDTKFDTGNTVTKEDLQKNPIVKQIITESIADQKRRYAEMETSLKAQMSEVEQSAARALADTAIRAEIDNAKIILGETPDVQARRVATITKLAFDGRKIKASDKGIIFVDNDGNTVTDDAGNPVTLASVVKEQGAIFGFHTQDPKKTGSGAGSGGSGAGGGSKITFESAEQFTNYLSTTTDPKLRAEAYQAWEDQSKDG
jgi:hypothetical protein